jgi:hypothetical protein
MHAGKKPGRKGSMSSSRTDTTVHEDNDNSCWETVVISLSQTIGHLLPELVFWSFYVHRRLPGDLSVKSKIDLQRGDTRLTE